MNSIQAPSIFIVEDDRFYGEVIKNELEQKGYTQVEIHQSGEECISNLYKMPDIILLDYLLADSINGVEVLKLIKTFNPDAQVIMLSGQEELNVAVNSLKYGAFDYVIKKEGALSEINTLIEKIIKWNEVLFQKHRLRRRKRLLALGLSVVALALLIQSFITL